MRTSLISTFFIHILVNFLKAKLMDLATSYSSMREDPSAKKTTLKELDSGLEVTLGSWDISKRTNPSTSAAKHLDTYSIAIKESCLMDSQMGVEKLSELQKMGA
jgi:hypothetical protein